MKKLKVGDQVVKKVYSRWDGYFNYYTDEVIRLTPTLAVFKSGVAVTNSPFLESGNTSFNTRPRDTTYYLMNDKLKAELEEHQKLEEASNWWYRRYGTKKIPRKDKLIFKQAIKSNGES